MTRVPLGELPLARFLPPSARPLAHMCSSPVLPNACPPSPSRPSKRGPPTPTSHALRTPKRHISAANVSISVLDTDDLGVGRSPVRRLFTPGGSVPRDIPNHTHNTNHTHPLQNPTNSNTDPQDAAFTGVGLAPSPPISRRPSPLNSAPGTPKRSIHDIGFVIYCDEDENDGSLENSTESRTAPVDEDNVAYIDGEDGNGNGENMPPPRTDTTPRAKRRAKATSTPALRPLRSSTPLAHARA